MFFLKLNAWFIKILEETILLFWKIIKINITKSFLLSNSFKKWVFIVWFRIIFKLNWLLVFCLRSMLMTWTWFILWIAFIWKIIDKTWIEYHVWVFLWIIERLIVSTWSFIKKNYGIFFFKRFLRWISLMFLNFCWNLSSLGIKVVRIKLLLFINDFI